MPRSDIDETWDQQGNLITSVPRLIPDEAIAREDARMKLRTVNLAAIPEPTRSIIADILRVLGLK